MFRLSERLDGLNGVLVLDLVECGDLFRDAVRGSRT